jgi:hypothetical protein
VPTWPQLSDTTPEAAKVQVDLLRGATVGRRLRMAWSLSAAVIGAARRALAEKYPRDSADDLAVRFAEVHYGPALAQALRAELARRRSQLDT